MIEHMELKARGKINLGLDVTGKREGGYHDVRMIMQTVGLYDKVTVDRVKTAGISVRTNLPYVPAGEGNLAFKAADALMSEFGISDGVRISIFKKIPVAGGMAGGSSDAAAVMVALNRMFGLGLSKRQLAMRAVPIGADIPYCIMRGTALAEGIGDELTPLPEAPDFFVALAKPPFSVSTKAVYSRLDLDALKPDDHPDIDGMISAIGRGDMCGIAAKLGNILERVTIPEHPEVGRIKDLMIENGAEGALMSGSGPTVFGLFRDYERAREACEKIYQAESGNLAKQVFVTEFFNRREK